MENPLDLDLGTFHCPNCNDFLEAWHPTVVQGKNYILMVHSRTSPGALTCVLIGEGFPIEVDE